ncbi:MAG TPA: hypothetical protein VNU64_06940 [Burkholderiales bacterium]|nr:hypothetical protein [Burkholderiales bacterium]
MLHEFLSSNREELIRRCRAKVRKRAAPPVSELELEHGVPLFLEQLVEALRCEQEKSPGPSAAISIENRRTAALHGKELLDEGYTVDQVVHDYGDICQAVTELADEKGAAVAVDEFRTFNRLLDNAISDAVSSFGRHRDAAIKGQGEDDQREWRGSLGDEQRVLIDIVVKAFDALKIGNIGLRGATGALLEASLGKLRELIDKSLPPRSAPPKP